MKEFGQFLREAWNLCRILSAGDFFKWLWLTFRFVPEILRTRSLAPVDVAFGTTIRFRVAGRWLVVRDGALGVVREIAGSNCYCRASELHSARHVLDLGANCGVFTLFALASAPAATVTSVEIQREMADATARNAVDNEFGSRVRVENRRAGKPSDAALRLFDGGRVPLAFDCRAYVEAVGTCDFMKCDIEGSEFGLFDAEATWLCRVAQASIEYHGPWEEGARLRAILETHGFKVAQKPHGRLGYLFARRF